MTYDREYYEDLRPASGPARAVDDARDALVARIVRSRHPRSALDVGCGRGDLLDRITADHKAGIEISEAGLALARSRLPGVTLVAADVEAGIPLEGPFDVVTAINVLEHLGDPAAGLRSLADVQDPGGTLVVHLPVIGTASQARLYAGSYDRDPTHVWRPSAAAARSMVEGAGYRHVSSAFAPFLPMWLFRHVPVHPAWLGVFQRRQA